MTGQELKALRKKMGKTQMEMAAILGISFVSYNEWEHRQELSRLGNLIVEDFLRKQEAKSKRKGDNKN